MFVGTGTCTERKCFAYSGIRARISLLLKLGRGRLCGAFPYTIDNRHDRDAELLGDHSPDRPRSLSRIASSRLNTRWGRPQCFPRAFAVAMPSTHTPNENATLTVQWVTSS